MDVPGATATQSHGRLQEETRDAGGITEPDQEDFTRSTSTRTATARSTRTTPASCSSTRAGSAVSAADAAVLRNFGATLGAPDIPPFPVVITGHASAEGEAEQNMRLSAARARNVANEIVRGGAKTQPTAIPKGEEGAAEDPTWRTGRDRVKDFECDQTTVKHEFGHILGLGDEYPTPTRPAHRRTPARRSAPSAHPWPTRRSRSASSPASSRSWPTTTRAS